MLGPEDANSACLLIYGFMGTPIEMRELAEALAEQGLRTHGIVLAGHETGNGDMLATTRRSQWIDSAEEGLRQLARHRYIFVAGLSMGGVLSLLLASRHPERITGVIAMSTPTRFAWGWQSKALPVARYFVKWFYPLSMMNFNDPKVQAEVLKQARLRDPNVTIDFSNAQVVASIKRMVRLPVPALDELSRLTNAERKALPLVRSPLLIIQSKKDQTVNPACAEELYRLATKAHPKLLHWLEQSDHVITTGPEKAEVIRLARDFINTTYLDAVKTALPRDAPHP